MRSTTEVGRTRRSEKTSWRPGSMVVKREVVRRPKTRVGMRKREVEVR